MTMRASLFFLVGTLLLTTPACSDDAGPSTTLYVDEAAPPGGNGTADNPFQTVREALELEGLFETLVVAPGVYEVPTPWTFPAGFQILGALDGTTVFVAEGDADRVEWSAAGGGLLVLRDLDLGTGLVFASGELELQEVHSSAVVGPGIILEYAAARFFGVTVSDVEELPGEVGTGDAVVVSDGSLEWQDGGISGAPDRGIVATAANLTLERLALSSTARAPLTVTDLSVVTASELTIEPASTGIYVDNATLDLRVSTVTGAQSLGLLGAPNAAITVTDSNFIDCPQGHLSVLGSGATVTLERNHFDNASAAACVAISNTDGAVVMRENVVDGCAGTGISLLSITDGRLERNEVSNVGPDPLFPEIADGISVLDSVVEMTGNRVHETGSAAISLIRSDGAIENNVLGPNGGPGISFVEPSFGRSLVRMNTMDGVTGVGVLLISADADVEMNSISNVVYNPADGFGDGIAFAQGADVSVVGNTVRDNPRNGIVFLDGATGEIRENTATGNAQYGILEICVGDVNNVLVGVNDLGGNGIGEQSLCP